MSVAGSSALRLSTSQSFKGLTHYQKFSRHKSFNILNLLSDALICVLRPFTIFSRRNYFDVFVILKFRNHDTLKSIAIKLFIKSIRGTVPTFVGIGCAYWVPRSFFRAQIILLITQNELLSLILSYE